MAPKPRSMTVHGVFFRWNRKDGRWSAGKNDSVKVCRYGPARKHWYTVLTLDGHQRFDPPEADARAFKWAAEQVKKFDKKVRL